MPFGGGAAALGEAGQQRIHCGWAAVIAILGAQALNDGVAVAGLLVQTVKHNCLKIVCYDFFHVSHDVILMTQDLIKIALSQEAKRQGTKRQGLKRQGKRRKGEASLTIYDENFANFQRKASLLVSLES